MIKFFCRLVAISLIALAWNIPAFCWEIHDAVKDGNLEKVKSLLKIHPALDSIKDNDGATPMHIAAWSGHKDIAELLIAKGADINAKTNFDATPLDMAMANGGKEIAEWLRQHGASAGSGVLLDIPPVHKPTLLSQPLPRYTEKARNANIGGTVVLQAVIRKDGSITDVKVLKGLGYGLDESVINTITGKWRFNPATLNGNPVDVGANITTSFHPF